MMKLFTTYNIRTLLLGVLFLGIGVLHLYATQGYPPSSYQLSGSTLTKWLGSETEIDFSKDAALKDIRNIGSRAFEGNATLKRIVLPPSLTELHFYAFQGCTALEEVHFVEYEEDYYGDAEQYLYLYDYCFEQCPKLQRVHLPRYLKKIEEGVFSECTSLSSITISPKHPLWRVENRALITRELPRTLVLFPPGITGSYTVHPQVSTIGQGAFYSSGLTSVFLPKSVETIEEGAFEKAKQLKAINFPIGLRTIKRHAFYRCASLSTFIFPNSLETIESGAFARCAGLPATVKLPAQIVSLAGDAFRLNPQVQDYTIDANNPNYMVEEGVLFNSDKTSLVSIPSGRKSYQLPEGIVEIGDRAFFDSSLEEIHFSLDLRKIGDYAFGYCEGLKVIHLPKGIQTLGASAFKECNAVTKIVLPGTLEEMGAYAFWRFAKDDSTLPAREVICHIPSPLDCRAWDNLGRNKDILYVPQEAVELYKIAPDWMYAFASILPLKKEHEEDPQPTPYELSPDGLTLLHWFRGDKEIDFRADEKLAQVRTIGIGAFAYNQNIERITLAPATETIAVGAFEQCSHLITMEAPALKQLEERAFLGCTALESIDLPTLSDVGQEAFADCSSLQTVSLSSVHIIGDEAFRSCSALYRVQLSHCITRIGTRAFGECSSLRELDIPCSEPPLLGEEVFFGVPVAEVKLTLPSGAEESYRNADQWKAFFSSSSPIQVLERGTIPPVTYHDGVLYVTSTEVRKIDIYSLQGSLIFSQEDVPFGSVYIGQLPRGTYVVRVDNRLIKFLV